MLFNSLSLSLSLASSSSAKREKKSFVFPSKEINFSVNLISSSLETRDFATTRKTAGKGRNPVYVKTEFYDLVKKFRGLFFCQSGNELIPS
jgi:hypothetical protein